HKKTGEGISDETLTKLKEDELDVNDCHGQGFDNGSNTRDHFWLVYTFQLNPPLGTAKTDMSLKCGQLYGTSLTANAEILGFMGNSI
ncbi:hypothetical protein J6590_107354, partial [Homalodisca vitripennis]